MGRKYIAVAGNMGAGKSSLVHFLCARYDVQPFYEPNEENPYLQDFYKDMKRWAFHSQVYFLCRKFRIHQELDRARSSRTVIQDRTIYEDAEIFAANLYRSRRIAKRDYETYRALYESMVAALRPPDLLIFLSGSLRTIRKRIQLRGRPEEQSVPVSYLRRLNLLYEDWFKRYDLSPTVVLQTDEMDYVTNLMDRLDLIETIERILG
ncbi:MAG: deoxynucleoside kinase [Polyangia bacterium]|jgi:deoxyadenosine/deoxycytidine kinase|nr:deoxynucleoside kinase [Polyangia bacterium]